MKKLIILTFVVLSVSAYAQSGLTASGWQDPHFRAGINIPKDSPVQLYDSIYYWKWQLSKSGWEFFYKIMNMSYDGHNNLTGERYLLWNNDAWVYSGEYIYSYDDHNNLVLETYQEWIGNSWVNSSQHEYQYVDDDLQASYHKIWENNNWTPVSQYNYVYDVQHNRTRETYLSWNGSSWQNVYQHIYSYDISSKMVYDILQEWEGNDWIDKRRYCYSYNPGNLIASKTTQYWTSSFWLDFYLETFAYDAGNNMTGDILQSWNGSEWININQYIRTYDANNNMTDEYFQVWNGNTWGNNSYTSCSYDEGNRLTEKVIQIWNGSSWVISNQHGNTYDPRGFTESEVKVVMDNTGTEVVSGDSTHYYFHFLGIPGSNNTREQMTIFPDPATEYLNVYHISAGYLTIVDLSGRMVHQEMVAGPKTSLNVSTLRNGVYLVKVVGENGVQVGKVIKE